MKTKQLELFARPTVKSVPPFQRDNPVGVQATLDYFYWKFALLRRPPVDDLGGERLDDNNVEFPSK